MFGPSSQVENIDLDTALDTTEEYIPLSLSTMYAAAAAGLRWIGFGDCLVHENQVAKLLFMDFVSCSGFRKCNISEMKPTFLKGLAQLKYLYVDESGWSISGR